MTVFSIVYGLLLQDIAGHIQKRLAEKGTNATFDECYDAGGFDGDSSDRSDRVCIESQLTAE